MATPKGMRSISCRVSGSDAIHVYSGLGNIWLQLRRNVETHVDIGTPSFKTAFNLTPTEALAIAGELLSAASICIGGNAPEQPAPSRSAAPPQRPQPVSPSQPANQTKAWTPAELKKLTDAFDADTPIADIAKTHQRTAKSIAARLRKLGRSVPPQKLGKLSLSL